MDKNFLSVSIKKGWWLWKNNLDLGMVWTCGKKEGMEKEIKSTSKRCLYHPLSTGGKTEAEKQFTQIPLSLVIVRAKNFFLPVLNINHKAIPLHYYICYLFYLVFSFQSASDLHKHVGTQWFRCLQLWCWRMWFHFMDFTSFEAALQESACGECNKQQDKAHFSKWDQSFKFACVWFRVN